MRIGTFLVSGLAIAATFWITPQTGAALVDVELSLLVDVSGSVDANEFIIQQKGYSAAFRYSEVINDILTGPNGGIAVNLIYWSGDHPDPLIGAREVIPWRILNSASAISDFAQLIDDTPRPTDIGTHTNIAGAIDFAWPLFGINGFDGTHKIMDVSGDGVENLYYIHPSDPLNPLVSPSAAATIEARDRALAAGIDAINGLVIKDSAVHDDVTAFYDQTVIGGDAIVPAFVITVETREEFGDGLLQKLDLEIPHVDVVPEPASILVWSLLSVAAIVVWRRRHR